MRACVCVCCFNWFNVRCVVSGHRFLLVTRMLIIYFADNTRKVHKECLTKPAGECVVVMFHVKTVVLTHKVLTTSTPPYLHDMLTVAAPARSMRSAGAPLLFVPRVRTQLDRRAFSVTGPTVFNSLPPKIRLSHQ